MIGISHLLRRVSQVWVTIGALIQQLIFMAGIESPWKSISWPTHRKSVLHQVAVSLSFTNSLSAMSLVRSLLTFSPSFFLSSSRRTQQRDSESEKNQPLHTSRANDLATRYRRSWDSLEYPREYHAITATLYSRSDSLPLPMRSWWLRVSADALIYHMRKREPRIWPTNGNRKRRVYCVAGDATSSRRDCELVSTCYDDGMALESNHRTT